MNRKILLIACLLFIFTIASASAADNIENQTVEDSSVDDDILSMTEEDKTGTDEIKVFITDEKLNLSKRDSVIMGIECPENVEGTVTISFQEEGSSCSINYYIPQDINRARNWTLGDLFITDGGKYFFTLNVITNISSVTLDKPVKIINPDKNITAGDFETNIADTKILGSADDTVITIRSPVEAYGNVTVTVDDREFTRYVSIRDNIVRLTMADLNITDYGTYRVRARFTPEDEGDILDLGSKDVLVTYVFEIFAIDNSPYGYECYEFDYEENVRINITLPGKTDGILKAYFNGIERALNENNSFTISADELSVGVMKLKATLNDDSKYPNRTITNTFNVIPRLNMINLANGRDIDYAISRFDRVAIISESTQNTPGKLYVYKADEKDYIFTPVMLLNSSEGNGTLSVEIPLDGLDESTVPIFVVYQSGELTYNSTYMYYRLIFKENSPEVDVKVDNATLRITTPESSVKAYVYVDGKSLREEGYSLMKGEVNIQLTPGNHMVYINIKDWYLFYSKPFDVNVTSDNATPSNIVRINAKDMTKYYARWYGVTVTKNGKAISGETVVFKLNGKKVASVKTNSNGYASFKLLEKPGIYKVSVEALGISTIKKVKIKQVLFLKKAKVKKSAKRLILRATLKEGKKPLKGKTVRFKFKGKTFKAKTNKKGIAKVKVKKSILKKLKVGKKITYKATYLKNTVKRTVKVKK